MPAPSLNTAENDDDGDDDDDDDDESILQKLNQFTFVV